MVRPCSFFAMSSSILMAYFVGKISLLKILNLEFSFIIFHQKYTVIPLNSFLVLLSSPFLFASCHTTL